MTTAHEPRRGPGTHLSVDDVSALAEGAQPSAADAGEHLLACAACRGEVEAVSELLAQFEQWDAPAIPQEVAIRIDAALARESAARAQTSGDTAPTAHAAAPSSAAASRSPRRRRLPARALAWALASLVLVAGGVGLALDLASPNAPTGTTASSAGTSDQPKAGPNELSSGGQGAVRAPDLAAPAPLAQWTRQVLASSHNMVAPLASSCPSDPAYSGRQQLATASGSYDGAASMLVVYANPSDPSMVLAVVYAAPCTATNYRVLERGLVAR